MVANFDWIYLFSEELFCFVYFYLNKCLPHIFIHHWSSEARTLVLQCFAITVLKLNQVLFLLLHNI